MESALDLDCSVDLSPLEDVLGRLAAVNPARLATEVRHAAILLCKSLRARTKEAPKNIRKRTDEWSAVPSPDAPRYLTYRRRASGKRRRPSSLKLPKPLRRWQLTRRKGTERETVKNYFVYTRAARGKSGRMAGKSAASERAELLRVHGGIPRAGIARKSWGWIAKKIYNAASGLGDSMLAARQLRGVRRDPRAAVDGRHSVLPDGAAAELKNALDYIASAVPPSAVSEAAAAAAKNLERSLSETLDNALKGGPAASAPAGAQPFWKGLTR